MTDPVTTPLRSDRRKTTKSAISSTWPSLPIGTDAAAFSRQSSPAPWNCALGRVLALGVGPPDVHAVDPDAVPPVGVRGVAGSTGEPRLGRDVGGEIRLTAELGDGDDVHDRPRSATAEHVLHDGLHGEEGAAEVDRDVGVEQLGSGVDQRAPGGEPGRVDQAVDPAELRDGPRDRRLGLGDVAHVGLHEQRRDALLGELGHELLTGLRGGDR